PAAERRAGSGLRRHLRGAQPGAPAAGVREGLPARAGVERQGALPPGELAAAPSPGACAARRAMGYSAPMEPAARARIPLGNSGLAVAPCGGGMWRFGPAGRDAARARAEAALETGCTLFDTADIYGYDGSTGFGAAEQLLGAVLREAPGLREHM